MFPPHLLSAPGPPLPPLRLHEAKDVNAAEAHAKDQLLARVHAHLSGEALGIY